MEHNVIAQFLFFFFFFSFNFPYLHEENMENVLHRTAAGPGCPGHRDRYERKKDGRNERERVLPFSVWPPSFSCSPKGTTSRTKGFACRDTFATVTSCFFVLCKLEAAVSIFFSCFGVARNDQWSHITTNDLVGPHHGRRESSSRFSFSKNPQTISDSTRGMKRKRA